MNILSNIFGRGKAEQPLAPIENKLAVETSPAVPLPTPLADSIVPPVNIPVLFSQMENERTSRRMEVEVQADEIRRSNRAQTATLFEENRLAELQRQKQQTATEAERQKQKSRPKTWEEIHEPFITSVDRGDSVRIRAELPGVTKQLLLALITHGKLEALQARTIAAIQPHAEAWEAAFAERSSLNHDAVRKKLLDIVLTNEASVKAGDASAIRPTFDREENDKVLALQRSACRQKQKAASNGAKQYIAEFAASLQTAARALALDLIGREKILASEFSVPFSPSAWTRQIILCGFDLQKRIEENSFGTGSSPAEACCGLLDTRKQAQPVK